MPSRPPHGGYPGEVVGPNPLGCRYPGLRCDRLCMECRGDFDVVDRKTGRVVGDVSDTVAMNRMLREFGEPDA
jgi:hypothetical protein